MKKKRNYSDSNFFCKKFVQQHLNDPIPSSASLSNSYITVDDLSDEEIADVKKYIAFLKIPKK